MAAISLLRPSRGAFDGPIPSLPSNTSTLRHRYVDYRIRSKPSRKWRAELSPTVTSKRKEYDVVIVGAGIIGLSVARQFLIESDLSVAIVDARVPCSGATGAGIFSFNFDFNLESIVFNPFNVWIIQDKDTSGWPIKLREVILGSSH